MNRRNVLVGLGGLVAGGGALISTGAFDTVEAQRTVSVETAGDAAALLGLAASDGDPDNGFVTGGDDGPIEIAFDGTAGNNAGDGLNQRARTTFLELVDVTNQGTQDVDVITLELEHDGDDDIDGVFSYPIDGNAGNTVANGGDIIGGETLTPGEGVTFGLIVDLLDNTAGAGDDAIEDLPEGADYTLTITAEAAE